MPSKSFKGNERGAALVEFAIGATVFLTATFGIIEFGRLLWTHNALADAARRGARYAVTHPATDKEKVQNVVVYGDENGGSQPLVRDLKAPDVEVVYKDYTVGSGTVSVRITNYKFQFVVPLFGRELALPDYHTTLTGESIGWVPKPIS